ncbi:CPSF A subunit region-domain-containing protein [Tuber indicum]|nr:CPSF A subunit region-domain-containing protein [Tuber indicum]
MYGNSIMFMYSRTVLQPSTKTQAIFGPFSWMKQQQIIGKAHAVLTIDVFGIIRCLAAFRLAGSSTDYVIVGSDSGLNTFHQQHLAAFRKSRVRRVIPEQFPLNNKLVNGLNRNAQVEPTISSPLEAHKPHIPVFALVSLDVGYDNPVFAAREVDYGESDQDATGVAYVNVEKMLVNYELDIRLNHVVRKWPDTVDRSANILFQVPGGADGPWDFLVSGEDSIYYRHNGRSTHRVPILRHVMHGMRGAFIFLLQTEDADLLKLTLDYDDESGVSRIKVEYFDTVPIASSLFILKSGFLFVVSEGGNQELGAYDVIEFSSDSFSPDPLDRTVLIYLHGRAPENISLVEAIDNMNPLHGLETTAITTKPTNGDELDAYIVLSFANGTPVLSSGETVEELGEEALLQVHPMAIRLIRADRRHRSIVAAPTSSRKVAVALSSGDIVYFEIDSDGQLMSGTVTCLSLGEVPKRWVQSPFWALGSLTSAPSSLCIMALPDSATEASRSLTLYLHIGLYSVTAELTDTRTSFLGPKPVQVFKVIAQGLPTVLALSSRLWLGYSDARGQFMLTPLTYPTFEWVWTFRSEQCLQGMKLTDNLKQESIPPSYTPRKMLIHLDQPVFYVAEADANTLSLAPIDTSVVDPISIEVTDRIELDGNEATFSIVAVSFSSRDDEWFLVRFLHDGKELEFIHKTKIGKDLNIYDLGTKQLLRKARGQVVPNLINGLQTQGSRIRVLDVQESVTFVVYGYQDKRLIPFAGDMIPRFTKCTATAGYETVAGGDRFGNFWIFRCAQKASDESDEDPAGGPLMHKRPYHQVAPNCLNLMLIVPFVSREYEDLFRTLELYVREEDAPIAGRDHLIYWGYYVRVKDVIDGDLCENYSLLIAEELDRRVREEERKIAIKVYQNTFISWQ